MIETSITNCSYFNPQQIGSGFYKSTQFASSTCFTSFTSTSTQKIYSGFTAGEIVISLFLFLMFLGLIFNFFIFKFFGIRIHKQV